MISRGYTGEARTLSTWRLQRLDYIWSAVVAVGLVALVCGKVREYAERMAPGLKVKVLLAGYGTGVLYFE